MHDDIPPLRALLRERARPGTLTFIGVRSARGEPMRVLSEAVLLEGRGIAGDRASARRGGKRQVSILQAEHLDVVAQLAGRPEVAPELLRRNLVVRGFSVLSLRASYFRVGPVLLRGVGTCDPCSKMERALGVGGYNAMRGHGGILAQVVCGGTIALGDAVDFADEPAG
jgi:MOSC domain-containing protein YiiM